MGGRQSVLSMSHGVRGGLFRTSGSRMTRREQILATVLVVGLAVWYLAMYSSPGASHLQSSIKTTQQETSYGQIRTTGDVVPRRLSDANGGQQSGLEGSSGQHRSTDAPQVPTLPTVSTLAQDAAEQQPMDTQPQAPRTVAELISDVRANGAPSSRPKEGPAGLMLYPIVVEQNLSTADFTRVYGQEYAAQPVKIKNSQTDWWRAEDWTLDALREQVGEISPYRAIKKCREGMKNRHTRNCHRAKEKDPEMLGRVWAAMADVDLEEMGVTTYNQLFDKQIELAKQERYIYLQEVGPRWLLDFVARLNQPKYFMNNIGDVVTDNKPDPRELLADDIFPAFFFGPAGSQSPLHTDARMTRFWILELTGTKLIRIIPPSNNWRADATDQSDFQPELFTADILVPDFEQHPHLDGMVVYETLLEPGDVLYIPEGWAHQALNLDFTVMASYNYNDENSLQNRLSYFHYDKPSKEQDTEIDARQFYLPLVNMSSDVGNMPITDYFRMNCLEYAPVSDAARSHINKLKSLGIKPDEWRDYFSRPVLGIATTHNYIELAKWLVEEGVPLENDSEGRYLLKRVESGKLEAMARWMREHMGVDASDDLSDIEIDD